MDQLSTQFPTLTALSSEVGRLQASKPAVPSITPHLLSAVAGPAGTIITMALPGDRDYPGRDKPAGPNRFVWLPTGKGAALRNHLVS